jgi:hypothetical protein
MVTVYFEDPKIHPRIMNSAVRHSLWRFTKRHNAAFRVYTAAHLGQLVPGQLAGSNEEASSSPSDKPLSYSKAGACALAASCQEGPASGKCCGPAAPHQVLSLHGVLRGSADEPSYASMRTLLHRQRSGNDDRARPPGFRRFAVCTALAICARQLL